MPQLIAMIIIVVGAMIYMFQTFGGTGDKIEGIAQKTSIITEINNIKNGLKLAARAGDIRTAESYSITVPKPTEGNPDATETVNVGKLKALGYQSYFAEQINVQLQENSESNKYYAISFGGQSDDKPGDMVISLVSTKDKAVPGIYVDLSVGGLASNAGFLEAQIAADLEAVAYIARKADSTTSATAFINAAGTSIEQRTPSITDGGGTEQDGKFIVYFKDFGANEVVIDNTP